MNRSRENLPVTISADWHSPIISATIYLPVARRGSIIADVMSLGGYLMKNPILGIAIFIIACSNVQTFANNNLFLPGDAFFPTELTADSLAKLATEKSQYEFVYSSFGGYEGAFCGYAGYNRAQIPSLDAAFADNLKLAYGRIREFEPRILREEKLDGKTVLRETNGVRVLFYRESFEFPKYKFGLRYNENWLAETVKFGHQPNSVRLCCLIDSKDAVMVSWRDARFVKPLDVTLPKIKLKPVPETDTPISINGKIKAIVLDSTTLEDFFQPSDGASFLTVDASGVTEMCYEENKWRTNSK